MLEDILGTEPTFFRLSDADDNVRPRILSVLVTLALIRLFRWIIRRKQFIDAVNKLPGLPMRGDDWDWRGNFGSLLDTRGQIPNCPEVPVSVPWFYERIQRHAKDGIMRVWAFDPYRIPFARVSISVFDPDIVKQLLVDKKNSSKLIKDKRIYKIANPIIGSSFLALPDGPEWKHQRKMTAPAFSQTFLEYTSQTAARLMTEKAFALIDQSPRGVEALEWSASLTTEILGLVAFNHAFGALEGIRDPDSLYETLRFMLEIMTKRLISLPYMYLLPSKDNREFNKACQRLDSVIGHIVEERLAEEKQAEDKIGTQNKHKDLLSYMMLKDDEGQRLSYEVLFGNVRMLLFAGHDTTANTLAYALWELASHQDTQEQLRREVDSLFNTLKEGESPSYKQLIQLKFLDAVVKEALRLHPPAAVVRTTTQDVTLRKGDCTYTIPAGCSIFIFPKHPQTMADFGWDDKPDTFWPQRFLQADSSSKPWFPFSIGPRNCVGQPLALAELKSILAHVIRRYVVKPSANSTPPIPVMLMTLKPHEVLLDFERRKV